MGILNDAQHITINGGTFTDVQGDIIHYYGIREEEQGA
jgi:hypothetical protein